MDNVCKSLSVFFPAYEDGDSIGQLVTDAFAVLRTHVPDHEVIVVNDGSSDHTGQVLARMQERYPRLRVITHPVNRGYGAALQSGFAAASKEFVFYTDGDGQYDIHELPLLLGELAPGVGWVNGYKAGRSDAVHRRWIGGLYNQAARRLFHLHLRDVDCDFRLIRKDLIRPSELRSTSGTICIEIARQLESQGVRAIEVAVSHLPRLHGSSRFFRPVPLMKTAWQIGRLYASKPWEQPASA